MKKLSLSRTRIAQSSVAARRGFLVLASGSAGALALGACNSSDEPTQQELQADASSSPAQAEPMPTPVSVTSYPTQYIETRLNVAYASKRGSFDNAKWVATTGSDSNSGSSTAPYATMAKALASLGANGVIVVRDGQYRAPAGGWVNDRRGVVPQGLRVFAQNPFRVRIISDSGDYYGSAVLLERAQNVWIDGFVFEHRSTSHEYAVNLGRGNKLSRCIVKCVTVNEYGGAVAYGDECVVEDVHAYGAGRYLFFGGTGGASVPSGQTVLRRCVSYLAFGPLRQPTASFAFYGSNDGAYTQVANVLFANCYEIDSPGLYRGDPNGTKWGAWYHPKSVRNVRHVGCGVINGGATYGAFRTDNYGGPAPQLASYEHCLVVGLRNGSTGAPQGFSASSGNGVNPARNCTVVNVPGAAFASNVPSTNALTANVPYPVRMENGLGAEQRYAIGAPLTRWGEAEFDVPQIALPLWPFPYEQEIARVFAEVITRPAGFYGLAQTANPFAQKTFTARVWESTGNPLPAAL